MDKLSMCRICLVENVRMCVVTNKSLLEMYEKLTDVPFVTKDSKPMLACLFCCTRLKQCCQLQRQCVAAEELLAQMLSEDYEQKPLTNRGHLGFVGRFIVTPIENINIVDDCQIGSDAIKQEPPDVCEEQVYVEFQPAHQSEELDHGSLVYNHLDVKEQLLVEIKIEEEEFCQESENLRVGETERLKLENPDESYPGVEDIPAHDSESDSEDDVPLLEIKTEAEEGQRVSKRPRRACVTRRKAVAKKPTLKRKLEDTIPAKQSNSVKHTHSSIHTGQKPFKCDVCHRSFGNKGNLNVHLKKHSYKHSFKCDICQRSFCSKGSLKVHLQIHTGEKPHKCHVCHRSFNQKSNLNVHLKKHFFKHFFKCDICQRSFCSKGSLIIHLQIHTGEKPYKCYVCQRSFNQKGNLNVHLKEHSYKLSFKCDVCQRSFCNKGNLNKHSLTHSVAKPYKCNVCQRSFSQNSSLKIHSRRHTGEKPYQCDVCQRSFVSKTELNVHLKKHSGEKPYKCNVCQRSFTQKSNLNVHSRQHTDEKPDT